MEVLDKIAGIIGYALVNAEDGSVEEVKGSSTSPLGDLTAFFSSAGEVIRDSLSIGSLNTLSLTYGGHRLLIFLHGDKYLGIEVERENEPEAIIGRIKTALGAGEKEAEVSEEEAAVPEEEEEVVEEAAVPEVSPPEKEEDIEEEEEKEPEEEMVVEEVEAAKVEIAEPDTKEEEVAVETKEEETPEEEEPEEEVPAEKEEEEAEVEEEKEVEEVKEEEEKEEAPEEIELPRSISSKMKQINFLVDEFGGDDQKEHWLELLTQGIGVLGGDITPHIGIIDKELRFKGQPPEELEDDFVQGLRSIIDFLVKKAVEEMGSSQARSKVQKVIERMK